MNTVKQEFSNEGCLTNKAGSFYKRQGGKCWALAKVPGQDQRRRRAICLQVQAKREVEEKIKEGV